MENTSFIKNRWRPLLGIVYCVVVLFDFVIAPMVLGAANVYTGGAVGVIWTPLTLNQSGLFHVAMGSVLGITSWSRGQEKINGVAGK